MKIPKIFYCLVLGGALPLWAKTTRFQELLRPVDFANLYEKNTPTITRRDLYSAIVGRNLDIKQSRIDVDLARQGRDLVYTQMFVPRTSLTGNWTQEKLVSGSLSSTRNLSLGLSFGATTDIGLAYQLSIPNLSLLKTYEGVFNSQTAQTATAGAEGRVSFSLLRGSLFFANGLVRKGAELDVNSADNSLKLILLNQLSQA
ncbi:MAG: hypothetical protein ACKOA8_04390, partial [Deltaproteobacteria bacterium]